MRVWRFVIASEQNVVHVRGAHSDGLAVLAPEDVHALLELALDPASVAKHLDQVLPEGAAGVSRAVDGTSGSVERAGLRAGRRGAWSSQDQEPLDVLRLEIGVRRVCAVQLPPLIGRGGAEHVEAQQRGGRRVGPDARGVLGVASDNKANLSLQR